MDIYPENSICNITYGNYLYNTVIISLETVQIYLSYLKSETVWVWLQMQPNRIWT